MIKNRPLMSLRDRSAPHSRLLRSAICIFIKPSGVFKRVGSSTRNANEDEILMMIMQSHNYIYEDEIAEEQELTFKQFERILSNNEIILNARLYKTLGLKNAGGKFTNLGYIMSDQSPVAVKFAEYDSHMNFLFRRLIPDR